MCVSRIVNARGEKCLQNGILPCTLLKKGDNRCQRAKLKRIIFAFKSMCKHLQYGCQYSIEHFGISDSIELLWWTWFRYMQEVAYVQCADQMIKSVDIKSIQLGIPLLPRNSIYNTLRLFTCSAVSVQQLMRHNKWALRILRHKFALVNINLLLLL